MNRKALRARCLLYALLMLIIGGALGACGRTNTAPAPPTAIPASALATAISPDHAPAPTRDRIPTLVVPTPLNRYPPVPTDWQDRWLAGTPCQVPCWEGITPGQTTIQEALDLLNHSALVDDIWLDPGDEMSTTDRIWWNWRNIPPGGIGGDIYYPRQGNHQTITHIWLGFPKTITLRELIRVYGNPSHVIPIIEKDVIEGPPRNYYNLEFVYLSRGISIAAIYSGTEKPKIDLDMELGRILLFSPTPGGFDAIGEAWDSTDLVPWQGVQDFDVYCQQAQAPPHQICRSIAP